MAAAGWLAAFLSQQYIAYLASRTPDPARGAIHAWEGPERTTVYLTGTEWWLASPIAYSTVGGVAFAGLGALITWKLVTKPRTNVLTHPKSDHGTTDTGRRFREGVLTELRRLGSDTAQPHEFDFFLYLPTRSSAWRAAQHARRSEFSASTVRCVSTGRWLCRARVTLVPELAPLEEIGPFFEQLAAALDGEFDGWEAELVRPRESPKRLGA